MPVRRVLGALGLAALAPVGLSYALESLLRHNLYRAGPYRRGLPEATGVPFEQVHFWTADGLELEGWLFEGGDLAATVLFMHGTECNASDMWATEERARLFGGFLRGLGCRLFVFDYRGYGGDSVRTTEEGTYVDAEGALAYLHNRREIDPARAILYGFSLGTGVATELALREPCAGLVLRAPFTSIRDLALAHAPWLRHPLSLAPWWPATRYESAAKIPYIRVPLLIMHGDADESVPPWMGRQLYDLAPEPKTFVAFPGAGHQESPLELMIPAVRDFVESVAGTQAERSRRNRQQDEGPPPEAEGLH